MNPQIRAFIEMLKTTIPADTPKMWQLMPPQARAQSERFFAPFNASGPQMAAVRDVQVPGRRGTSSRLHVPANAAATSPGLLYLHGGGFVVGSLSTHGRLARELAERLAARVLSLEYALAPEHPYPQGLDDCVEAARWLAARAGELGKRICGGFRRRSCGQRPARSLDARLQHDVDPQLRPRWILGALASL